MRFRFVYLGGCIPSEWYEEEENGLSKFFDEAHDCGSQVDRSTGMFLRGKEIFENDIISDPNDSEFLARKVYYDDKSGAFMLEDGVDLASWVYDDCMNLDIIGEAHTNPELESDWY